MEPKETEYFYNDQRYYPNDPLDKAIKFGDQGRYEEALVYCDKAIKSKPNEPSTYCLKSGFYDELDQYDKAIECIDRAIKYSIPPHKSEFLPTYLSLKLRYLHWADRNKAAIRLANKLILFRINLPNTYAYKGLSMHNLYGGSKNKKTLNKILDCYNKALEGAPSDIILDGKGRIFGILGEYDKAISCFKEALSLDPDGAIMSKYEIMSDLATALHQAGRYDESTEQCKQVLKLGPKNSHILYVVACTLYDLGLMQESLHALNTATRLDPSFVDTENLRRDIMSNLESA